MPVGAKPLDTISLQSVGKMQSRQVESHENTHKLWTSSICTGFRNIIFGCSSTVECPWVRLPSLHRVFRDACRVEPCTLERRCVDVYLRVSALSKLPHWVSMSAACQDFHSKTHITSGCENPAFAILREDFLKCDKFADFLVRKSPVDLSACLSVVHLSLRLLSRWLILAARSKAQIHPNRLAHLFSGVTFGLLRQSYCTFGCTFVSCSELWQQYEFFILFIFDVLTALMESISDGGDSLLGH